MDRKIDTHANPSAAPIAGGATSPGSAWGGKSWKAALLRMIARIGRHMTGFAYRELREMETHGAPRMGTAGMPNRAAGGPAPHELRPEV